MCYHVRPLCVVVVSCCILVVNCHQLSHPSPPYVLILLQFNTLQTQLQYNIFKYTFNNSNTLLAQLSNGHRSFLFCILSLFYCDFNRIMMSEMNFKEGWLIFQNYFLLHTIDMRQFYYLVSL